jgi:serine/threonine protein kinase
LDLFIKSSREKIVLKQHPFASGGEGALFELEAPDKFSHLCAKIYHSNKRTPVKQRKIEYLYQHPPAYDVPYAQGTQPVIWVKELLVDSNGQIMGFLMPYATGEKLEILCSAKLPRRLSSLWQRFDLKETTAYHLRLKLCFNVAIALRQMHKTASYVLVDLKPDNILVRPNGLVSIVDTDSLEVIEQGRCIFAATVATPEYTPPEYYRGVKPGEVLIEDTWDRFSLAVILYKLLFGIHPFAATAKPPFDHYNSLGDKIKEGLFVHDPNKKSMFKVVPPPHRKFYQIDATLQKLFVRAFSEGHQDAYKRPTAAQWCQALQDNPYLITNRALNIGRKEELVLSTQQYFEQNLQKLLERKKLLYQAAGHKNQYEKIRFAALVKQQYSSIFKWYMIKLLGYLKVTGTIVGTVLLFSFLFGGFDILIGLLKLFYFIPLDTIFSFIGFCGVIAFLIFPFLKAFFEYYSKKKSSITSIVESLKNKNRSVRLKAIESIKFKLIKKRTALEESMHRFKHELEVWSVIKEKRDTKYKISNQPLIKNSIDKFSIELTQLREGLKQQDKQTEQLINEEAIALLKCRDTQLEWLESHEVYGSINGETIAQKIISIASSNLFSADEKALHKSTLQIQKKQFETAVQAIREQFESKHAAIEQINHTKKIKIDALLGQSTHSKGLQHLIDRTLVDDSYKKLLIKIIKLQVHLSHNEDELGQINQDLQDLKKLS